MFFIEFVLNKRCNLDCDYCDLSPGYRNKQAQQDADLDYFEWCINSLNSNNLYIELTGGEPGLVKNLPDFIKFLNDSVKVKKIRLMSNGLVRINHTNLIDEVDEYNEHLINKIDAHRIKKFYNIDFVVGAGRKTVIVLTAETVKSILEHFEHFNSLGFFDENKFWLKTYVDRADKLFTEHKENIIKLFNLINTDYARYSINQFNIDKVAQKVCEKIGWLPVLDLEDKKIIHCGYHQFKDQLSVDLTFKNLDLLLNKKLFLENNVSYCENCHLYFDDFKFLLKNNKANRHDTPNILSD